MDKYDEAIAYLTEKPEKITDAWTDPQGHRAGCLFEYACGRSLKRPDGLYCGCLTFIRSASDMGDVAWTDELTAEIKNDERIPMSIDGITVAHLPVFAEWQRKLDVVLNREPRR